ncbi:MAG: hypothetical protein S4CHLAM6_08040 [Chlamydiae bacterium]|nr:hypothetical protein [Chlamydiota bacterium]
MRNPIDHIEELLINKLEPTRLLIDDKTHLHLNHVGHDSSKFHLKIEIESPIFVNKTKMEQHKLVMDILKPYLKEQLHSVSIETKISRD